MGKAQREPVRSKLFISLLLPAVLLSGVWQQRPALAQVSEVTGSAYGFFASVGLFGGPQGEVGPVPEVTLPAEGSAEPITETDPDGESAQYGPAIIVETTGMTVSTEGTTGPDGSVSSSSSVDFNPDQAQQVDPFNADNVTSRCTATEAELSGSVELNNASLVLNTNVETQEPAETIPLPADPEPNTAYAGTIDHVGDSFRIVFNEQITERGVLTVNAVHLYLGQNLAGEEVDGVARGNAIIGQSVCGVNATGAGQPGDGDTTTTAQSEETTTTTEPAETTTTTTDEAEDESGGGGTALLIGAVVVGGGLLVALLLILRRREGGSSVR